MTIAIVSSQQIITTMSETNRKKNPYGWVGFLLVLSVVAIASLLAPGGNNQVDREDLANLEGTLASPMKKFGGSKSAHYIKFELVEYPNIIFEISGAQYNSIEYETTNIQTGKHLQILIAKSDSELLNNNESKWLVQVYEIKGPTVAYLRLEEVNRSRKGDRKLAFGTLIGIGVILVAALILGTTGLWTRFVQWWKKIKNRN